jgi:hypothetical protein
MTFKTVLEITGVFVVLGAIAGAFYFLYATIQQNDAQLANEINQNSGGGLGSILGGVASLIALL